MTRLETLSPELASKLREVAPAQQAAAALAACEFAVSQAAIQHPLVEEVLRELRVGQFPSPEKRAEIDKLSEQLDSEYLDLYGAFEKGRASKEDYMQGFAKARAVAALSFASMEDAFEAAAETTYEAAATTDSKEALFALIRRIVEWK